MKNEYEDFPEELKILKQWVGMKFIQDPDNSKVMNQLSIDPNTGEFASIYDPNIWTTFEQAAMCYEKGKTHGLGFVYMKDNPSEPINLEKYLSKKAWDDEPITDIKYFYKPNEIKFERVHKNKKTEIKCGRCGENFHVGEVYWMCGIVKARLKKGSGDELELLEADMLNITCVACENDITFLYKMRETFVSSACLPSNDVKNLKNESNQSHDTCDGCGASFGIKDIRVSIACSVGEIGWSRSRKEPFFKTEEFEQLSSYCQDCGSRLDKDHLTQLLEK